MLGTQLSASGISVMHSDGDAGVDMVSSALTVATTCPGTLLGEGTPYICIPIPVKQLLILRIPSSYSVMS